ncbi:Asp f 13-like protein [Infundibulicybe gibba]|nr:Asp f 13-like protein [Infundibulicybe gibba]
MKFTAALASLSIALLPLVSAVSVSFDPVYDNASGSLTTVSCSDGSNGLINRGFSTFGSLPKFPHIGGAVAVEGFNSVNCGTCWQLTFTTGGVTRSVNVLAIDHASPGFNIAEGAMNDLTGGQAVQLGRIDAAAVQVASSVCGLT